MPPSGTTSAHSRQLDQEDPLASYRQRFVIDDPGLVYLLGNSLGRLPRDTGRRIQAVLHQDWGHNLVRAWNDGWLDAPTRLGDTLGRLLGAAAGQVLICDSTSVNLYKLVMAAAGLRPGRTRIVSDERNFPSDLYVLQGCIRTLGNDYALHLVPAGDSIGADQEALLQAIDDQTALVTLSHVAFKSGHLYDAQAVTQRAHQVGALVLWDLSHSAGVVPIDLDGWDVDLAVGCTYKYLNGGPGSPAFLYVSRHLQTDAESPLWGWFGHQAQFSFDLDFRPAPGLPRFQVGTPPILSLLALEPALELVSEAGIEAIRRKSTLLTSHLVDLFDALLAPLGFELGTSRDPRKRGSQVSLLHPEAYRITRALAAEMNVLTDFREPDVVRLGLAPLYTRFLDAWMAVDSIRKVVEEERYRQYSKERAGVT